MCVQLYTVGLIIYTAGLKCHREQLGGISASGLQIQGRPGVNHVFDPCQQLLNLSVPPPSLFCHQCNSDGNNLSIPEVRERFESARL